MAEEFTLTTELNSGFQTAALDYLHQSNLAYRPEFLFNDPSEGKKVLVSIEQELLNCQEFYISVAFITKSGITPLLQVLKELEKKGIKGKILTTDYLSFSEPEALTKLHALSNIELKMFRTTEETGGFHTKGYIFRNNEGPEGKKEEIYRFIIGSANMTLSAMTKNHEWNTKFVSTENGEMAKVILNEFHKLWESEQALTYDAFIQQYEEEYRIRKLREKLIREQIQLATQDHVVEIERVRLKPNKMQLAFVQNLKDMREQNVEKALLLSATGTGKTYASAFAARELRPKRVLFVVHREQIAKKSLQSFRKVFGNTKTYGLLSGTHKDEMDKDFLFSTMQMMAKDEIRAEFSPDAFDIIILDECHRAGANSYQKIMAYFKPKFWLGMTASPDTNNYDIYSLFDHNIAYEIRLQQALEEDLLCPFHYFGITDFEATDAQGVQMVAHDKMDFKYLVMDARVKHVIEKAEYFGYSGERVKGLVFCSRKDEAEALSEKFNREKKPNGEYYRTVALTGEDSQERREEVVRLLAEENDPAKYLDYVFTVDIFNEGVDIPEINQVIMLRPTQSPVVFIQQLGRGLRKNEDKEYVVILDFIGNYSNNFMIPIALSGDRSYNKDSMRRYVREGSRIIPGSSTIHFDEISRKRIYESIDAAKTKQLQLLKDSYTSLKNKLGRIPSVLDFKKYGSIDITKIFDYSDSYYNFLKRYEKDYSITLTNDEQIVIEFLSKKVVSFKRIQELVILRHLIMNHNRLFSYRESLVNSKYKIKQSSVIEESVYRNLTNQFSKVEEQKKYASCIFIEKNADGHYELTAKFRKMLVNPVFLDMVLELLAFGEDRWQEMYSRKYKDTDFCLFQKYTYEDVCRLLGWKKNMNAQNIGGYFYDADTKTMPVFINYQKDEEAIAYEDRFVSEKDLIALSKHPRKIDSSDADHIYRRKPGDKDNRIFLFVRKNKDDNEAKEFYFLGEMNAVGEPNPVPMEKSRDSAFEIHYVLDEPIRSDIYDYIVRD